MMTVIGWPKVGGTYLVASLHQALQTISQLSVRQHDARLQMAWLVTHLLLHPLLNGEVVLALNIRLAAHNCRQQSDCELDLLLDC